MELIIALICCLAWLGGAMKEDLTQDDMKAKDVMIFIAHVAGFLILTIGGTWILVKILPELLVLLALPIALVAWLGQALKDGSDIK